MPRPPWTACARPGSTWRTWSRRSRTRACTGSPSPSRSSCRRCPTKPLPSDPAGQPRGGRMRIGMIGLGKMGANMTERLLKGGHEVVAYDLHPDALKQAAAKGAETATSLEDLAGKLKPPRAAWLMLPAGHVTDAAVEALAGLFSKGDVIVDGGNSNYKEWMVLAAKVDKTGVGLVDAGTSGGVWGLTEGYCLMVGGTKEAVAVVEPALLTLAPEGGYAHVGP